MFHTYHRRHLRSTAAPALLWIGLSACDSAIPDDDVAHEPLCELDDEACAAVPDDVDLGEEPPPPGLGTAAIEPRDEPYHGDHELGFSVDPTAETVAVTGSWPVATVGCAFPDLPIPGSMAAFGTVVSRNTYPGVSHYFRSVSGNTFNLLGSKAYGWFTLPHPSSYYQNAYGEVKSDVWTADCLAAADAAVQFTAFKGINFVLNVPFTYAWGGSGGLTIDGASKTYGMVWLDYPQINNSGTIIHEIGHSLGLPHTATSGNCWYTAAFDPMGTHKRSNWLNPGGYYPTYFGVAHRHLLGWLDSSRVQSIAPGATTTVYLERADAGSGKVMARIPIGGAMYYTVEARKKGGTNSFDGSPSYEAALPNDGVVITLVPKVLGQYWDTWFMDGDLDCDTFDQDAVWTPGETFTDAGSGVSVSVLSTWSTGYKVAITAPVMLTVSPTLGKVTVDVSGTADRTCSGAPCVYPVAPAKTVVLTAEPTGPDEQFSGWSGCPNAVGATCTLAPASATAVTAHFEALVDCFAECFAACLEQHSGPYCSTRCNNLCD